MSLGPAEIISADIFLQSATPWGEEGGQKASQIYLKYVSYNSISLDEYLL